MNLIDYIIQEKHKNLFIEKEGKEHYSLLSKISNEYHNTILYDIGTYLGLSALALSSNQSNKIVSYDIGYFVEIERPENVEFRIGNFYTDHGLLKSPLIMFDIDPHNGKDEREFVDYLEKNNYKGIVIFDDIHLNVGMKQFWNSIIQEKHDYTYMGHWSGTGVVVFN